MFDRGDFAIGNVRIARDLRRRRNGNGNRNSDARHRGHDGRHRDVGNINVVRDIDVIGNLGDVRSLDILRHAGNVGIVGNVRRRLKQRCFIVDSNVNVVQHAGWQRSKRNSVGFLPDWQSWG